jgi:hypothetical protein
MRFQQTPLLSLAVRKRDGRIHTIIHQTTTIMHEWIKEVCSPALW